MLIRAATVDECAGLAKVQVDSYRHAYAGLLPPDYLAHFTYAEQAQDWRAWLAAEGADALYVALGDADADANEVLGNVMGGPRRSPDGRYDGEVSALHVRRAVQRRGIGRALLAVMAERLRGAGCTSLWLAVLAGNPARGFYEALGGQTIGEQTIRLDEATEAVEALYGWPEIALLCR